jgi:uncharacterized protein
MRRLFAFATVLLLTAPAWADFDDGLAAYNRGDYETAFEEWLPLAELGDADAQFNLAVMYDDGEGVPVNDAEAVKWYRLAAEQGHTKAQTNLGVMYYYGEGVPVNYVQAYKCFSLSAALGDENSDGNLDIIASDMTHDQIAEAQRLAAEWWEDYQSRQ